MFGFPAESEIKKVVPKDRLLGRVGLLNPATATQRAMFNADVSQVILTNAVSPNAMNVGVGLHVQGFFVAKALLKTKLFNEKSVEMLLHRMGQKYILLALCYGDTCRIALKHGDYLVYGKDFIPLETFRFTLQGVDLDAVWNGIVKQVAGNPWNDSLSVAENLDIHEHIKKLQKEIASLEKKARAESQPARKLELFNLMKAKVAELAEATHPTCHPEGQSEERTLSCHPERSA